MDVKWQGDSPDQINKFLTDWLRVTGGMRSTFEKVEFSELLFTRMKDSNVMRTTCEKFCRASHISLMTREHTYIFLLDSLQHHLDDVLEDRNLESSRAEDRRMVNADGNRHQDQKQS